MELSLRRHSVLPGFNLALGYSLLYVGLLVLIPLAGLFLKTSSLTWDQFWSIVTTPRALAAYRLSFGTAIGAALVNVVFGLIVAWVLVRYRFAGRRFIDSLIDLPFALPTAVGGIALTTAYSANGWLGRPLEAIGLQVAFTPLGILVALTFIGLPFVVRTVQPVLQDLEGEVEEAAATLGAGRWQTFARVVLPGADASHPDRFCAGVCARPGRVRIGGLHLGQHAGPNGDRPAADHDAAGAIRLHRRDRDRRGGAARRVRDSAVDQLAPTPHGRG